MPSHLTRGVFRSIVANKPLLYRGCLQRTARPRITVHHGLRILPAQRRTFLDKLFKPQRKIKSADLWPGFQVMADLAYMQGIDARPPAPAELAKAFRQFFPAEGRAIEGYHSALAKIVFDYLKENPQEDGRPWLTEDDLRMPFATLEKHPDKSKESHLTFGRTLYEELQARQAAQGTEQDTLNGDQLADAERFSRLLCLCGATQEAKTLVERMFESSVDSWNTVLAGFAREGNKEELLRTAATIEERGLPYTARTQEILVEYFGETGELEEAKRWYSKPLDFQDTSDESQPTAQTYACILKTCAFNGDQTFGHQVVASLLKHMPNKAAWDAIFVWSAAIGKGVDEVERMMKVMVRRNDEWRKGHPDRPMLRPDVDTINALVELSISRKDPYSAERYINLGEKRGIFPNPKTFTMQMRYRLSVNDIDGARAAYFGLQGEKIEDQESVAVINRLIQVMCDSKRHHFDDVLGMVDDLHERKLQFTPETVTAVCLQHLRRGEFHDAVDILHLHVFHYSPSQRATISKRFVAFCLDRQNSTADVWDTYQILRNVFGETPRDLRTQVMNEFFARKRSDMACHVFFHMRNIPNDLITATSETYVDAFTGFARNQDEESLELIHNQLKLDLNVEPDTRMRNALMLAYAAVGKNRRALEFWSEIVASKEGPTYSSIAIAFRSCEGMPFGDTHARPIWRRLKEMDIDIDKEIFTAYVGAIARNGFHDEAKELVESAEDEYGFAPDFFMLSNWFNATANIDQQLRVEEWIKAHHPEVWTEMEKVGHYRTMDGFGWRLFNINRDLDP